MKKYSLNEGNDELVRSLLLMKYDTKKTLTENKEVLEQYSFREIKNPNLVTDQDLMGDTGRLRSFFQMTSDFSGLLSGLPNLWDMVGFNYTNAFAGRRIGVKGVVDALDGWVDEEDLGYILAVIASLNGKCYLDDTATPPTKVPAINRFLELYQEDEGEDLVSEIQGVGTKTLRTGTEKIKTKIINLIESLKKLPCPEGDTNPEDTKCPPGQFYNPKIKKCQTTPCGGCIPSLCPKGTKLVNGKCVGGGGSSWRECTDFPLTKGCKGKLVSDIQKCVGASIDGKFGPQTERKISEKGYSTTVTKDVYDNIIKACGETNITGGEDDWRSAEEETGGTGDDFVSSSESNKNETEG